MEHQMTPFEGMKLRKVEHNGEIWFSIYDVIEILTNTTNPKRYWNDLKKRDSELDSKGGTQISYPLKMQTLGGKQNVICANTEGVLRIIMSVPSPKAEPFKLWLARVGKEQIEEMDNPELGIERIKALYKSKGYTDEWIETRLKTIDIRKQLTDEWKTRGVNEGQEYSILTAEIARATFGLTPSEHKDLKKLERQNLRDHMTNLELIFTMLGEETTRRIAVNNDAQGFGENYDAAARGGYSTGEARKRYEQTSGEQVVSADNFLAQIEEAKTQNNLPETQD
jgi:DNA-damage-inducible protein D